MFLESYFVDQLAFYGYYHQNKVNVRIHQVFVPLIYMTSIGLAAYAHPFGENSLSLAWVGTLVYAIGYTLLYWPAGIVLAPLLFLIGLGSDKLVADVKSAWIGLLVLHVASWIFQFYGHGVHEKRAPALLDNLVQALFLAPLFVFIETLFEVGYMKDIQADINKEIARKTREDKKKR